MPISKITGKDKKDNVNKRSKIEPHELITGNELEQARKALIQQHADLVVQGMLNKDVRSKLTRIVEREFTHITKGNKDVVDYIIRETIGTGVVEDILKNDPDITDIGYNGSELIIESNDSKIKYSDKNFEISDDYIVRLVNKFANTNDKEFTSKNPIFDGRFENVRINAVHSVNTAPESGTTMALRVVRPRLALTEKNFEGFAPMFMYDFFRMAALSKLNMVISGITGTGKTELHKLIASFIPFDDRIVLIEDTPETFLKEMFKDKDIYSWVTTPEVGMTPLIAAGLRNNPIWLMVTETRGKEAYEMIQAVLSGHFLITSLHAVSASAIPSRFVNMSKMGYQFSEESLVDDILRYFDLGIHIKMVKYNGHVIRYLEEIVDYHPDGNKTIFKQRFLDGVYYFETFELTDNIKLKMEEAGIKLDFPENMRSERPLDPDKVGFQATIPLDPTGRPDYKKIEEMGTTIEEILHGPDGVYDDLKDTYNKYEDSIKEDSNVIGAEKDGVEATVESEDEDTISEDKLNALKEQIKKDMEAELKLEVEAELKSEMKAKLEAEKAKLRPKPPIRRPRPKEKTLNEMLEQKKKMLKNERL